MLLMNVDCFFIKRSYGVESGNEPTGLATCTPQLFHEFSNMLWNGKLGMRINATIEVETGIELRLEQCDHLPSGN